MEARSPVNREEVPESPVFVYTLFLETVIGGLEEEEEEEEVVVVVVEVEVEVDERVEMTGFWSLCRFLLVTSLVRWLSSSLLIFVF